MPDCQPDAHFNPNWVPPGGGGICPAGLLEQTGATLVVNNDSYDSGSTNYVCARGLARQFAMEVGAAHPCEPRMGAKSVNVSNDGAYDQIQVTYAGWVTAPLTGAVIADSPKEPTGGMNVGTGEQPIACHPNYTPGAGSWGVIFGDGVSPNRFGRVLDEPGGSFKAFAPLPDGEDGRVDPIVDCATVNPADILSDACRLEGLESFLDPGAASYKYSRVTQASWAREAMANISRIIDPVSTRIPPLTLPDGRNFLLTAVSEDIQVFIPPDVSRGFSTSVDFQGSGRGGWNRLVYQAGTVAAIDLDGISSV